MKMEMKTEGKKSQEFQINDDFEKVAFLEQIYLLEEKLLIGGDFQLTDEEAKLIALDKPKENESLTNNPLPF